jgi:heptosyltransferase III
MSSIVFHHGALGDSVLLWPVLRAMGPVTLVAPWAKARLAERWLAGVRAVDGDSPEWSRLFVGGGQLEAGDGVRRVLAGADRVISFVSDRHDAWARNVEALVGAHRITFVPPRPAPGGSMHIVHRYADRLGIEPVHPPPRTNTDGPVVIHPGSGGSHKCWPVERFDALIEHLHAVGRAITLVLGEVERERLAPGWPRRWSGRCEIASPDTLVDLSQVLAGASVYVGNDSGPTHLAAQLGVRTIGLFGPTDPRVWGPCGPDARVLWPGQCRSMEWLSVETVIEAVAGR